MKKIITLICCVLFSMLLLTGCAGQEVNLDDAEVQQVEDNVKSLISLIVVELPADASADADWTANAAYSEADREVQLNLSKDIWEELQTKWKKENNLKIEAQSTYESAITSYLASEEENGTPTGLVDGYVYAPAEDGFTVTATLVTEVRNVEMVVLYDEDMYITSVSFNPVYTFGENMEKAALNTLLGMGTVFCILVLIMLIISSFSLISKFEKAAAKRKENKAAKKAAKAKGDAVDNTIAQIIEKEETELADDLELVAVISAAIAAYEGSSSTDGFVVRSIKKSNKRSWKSTLN